MGGHRSTHPISRKSMLLFALMPSAVTAVMTSIVQCSPVIARPLGAAVLDRVIQGPQITNVLTRLRDGQPRVWAILGRFLNNHYPRTAALYLMPCYNWATLFIELCTGCFVLNSLLPDWSIHVGQGFLLCLLKGTV